MLLNIRGEDPLRALSPYYSNFVSISRHGADIQLEFIFVDINQLAVLGEAVKKGSLTGQPHEVVGKTVAKIVMPGQNFLQIRDHLNAIFQALVAEMPTQEVGNVVSTDAL